jgi:hypothetical protein
MIKLTGFLLILSVALTLYTFIDCARRDETEIQKLPKWGWLLIILLTLITLPMALLISKKVLQGATGSQLIPLLGSTGKLQLLFAITFAGSLAL